MVHKGVCKDVPTDQVTHVCFNTLGAYPQECKPSIIARQRQHRTAFRRSVELEFLAFAQKNKNVQLNNNFSPETRYRRVEKLINRKCVYVIATNVY